MSRRVPSLGGAIALAVAGGLAHAAGPVGVIPFDGSGSGNGFTIDNAAFAFNDVASAPCPAGSACVHLTGTGNDMLIREVDTGSERFFQFILVEPDTGDGAFAYEAIVSSGGAASAIGTKVVIDDPGYGFYSTQAAYRGPLFGASAANNDLAVEVFQSVAREWGFQTFDMETTQSPNQGGDSLLRNGRVQILQYEEVDDRARTFGHTIVAGTYQTGAGTLSIGDESFTYAAGNALSATWVRSTLSDGEQEIDLGTLIYRRNASGTIGGGNAGGSPLGPVDPPFTQDATDDEIRGFSQVVTGAEEEPAFVGADGLLAHNWDEAVFGPNPY